MWTGYNRRATMAIRFHCKHTHHTDCGDCVCVSSQCDRIVQKLCLIAADHTDVYASTFIYMVILEPCILCVIGIQILVYRLPRICWALLWALGCIWLFKAHRCHRALYCIHWRDVYIALGPNVYYTVQNTLQLILNGKQLIGTTISERLIASFENNRTHRHCVNIVCESCVCWLLDSYLCV